MTTLWVYRIFLFVRAADNTQANRDAFAAIYANNGSGETAENEAKMLDSARAYSLDGQPPAVAYGLNSAAKLAMRDEFGDLLESLTNARYGVVRESDNVLIRNNWPGVSNGITVTWADAEARLEAEFGLIPIVEEAV